MRRFSWLDYARQLFQRRAPLRRRHAPRRLPLSLAVPETLESRWLLSATSAIDEYVVTDEIAEGAVIHRAVVDAKPADVPSDASGAFGPTWSPDQLNGNGLQFNFIAAPGMPQFAIDGFRAAADLWSQIFTDDIVVNLRIDFSTLSPGVLGSTLSTRFDADYGAFRSALVADATSTSDVSAVASLQAGPALQLLINRTSDNPNGAGSATPYLDNDGGANNRNIWSTSANAKAAGLLAAGNGAVDGEISFSDQFAWDFDRSDGISAGAFDFIGVAAHEIGHALGFVSGVDLLDGNAPPINGPFSDDEFVFVAPLDLFRYSSTSVGLGAGTIDWTADSRPKYFSIDGGATSLTTFSLGRNFGDGQQASHWQDDRDIGILDPTGAPGEYMDITPFDVQAFDVMGWDVAGANGVAIVATGGNTTVAEAGLTDTYTITLTSVPDSPVSIQLMADDQTEVTLDGNTYFSTLVVNLSDTTPLTVTVRAVDDGLAEGTHLATINHAIVASADADFPTSLQLSRVNVVVGDNELRAFERLDPLGGLISVSEQNLGSITAQVTTQEFSFYGQAGQTFSAIVDPDANVTMSLQLVGVSGSVTTAVPGQNVILAPQLIPADGYYRVRVSAPSATTFNLTAYLNTALEASRNDTADGNELTIDSSRLNLANAGRYAVVGTSTPIGGGPFSFSLSFDLAKFVDISGTGTPLTLGDDDYSTIFTTVGNAAFPAGAVSVSNNGGIIAGANQFLDYSNTTLPSTSFINALLPFWDDIYVGAGRVYWQELTVNGIETLIVQWENLPHISAGSDAGTFQLQLFKTGPILARYVYEDVNFGSADYNFGASATIGYQRNSASAVTFSYQAPSVGTGSVLDLRQQIPPVDVDEYTIDLTGKAGQRIDVILSGLNGVDFSAETLQLIGPNGTTVLATARPDFAQNGINAENVDLGLPGFMVPADGIYTLRVTTSAYGQYGLVVTDSMSFETENNDTIAGPLRNLSELPRVLGYLGNETEILLTADFSDGENPSLDGFTIDNSGNGLWHVSNGRSVYPLHSAPYSLYFGQGEGHVGGGNYNTGARSAGSVTSPVLDLTTVSEAWLDLRYLLQTEVNPVRDVALIQVSVNGGDFTDYYTLSETGDRFAFESISLTPFAGSSLQFRFVFDTVDEQQNAFEGWYLDDVTVRTATAAPPDNYVLTVNAGELVLISTTTPFNADEALPANLLNPAVRVIHPDGTTVVAADLDSAGDGMNAQLSFVAPVGGTYRFEVSATTGRGEYILLAGVDQTPPVVTALSPADNATNVAIDTDLEITFNKAVVKGSGSILVRDSLTNTVIQAISVSSSSVVLNNNVVSIDITDLASTTGYWIEVPAGAFRDTNGNSFAGITSSTAWNFTTEDVVAPLLTSLSPVDNSFNVPVDANLVVTFNEPVMAGSGNVIIRRTADNSVVQAISIGAPQISISGSVLTVNPADLTSSTEFFVQIDSGAILDLSGNAFAGIVDSTTWTFTTVDATPPTVVSLTPTDNSIDVGINTNLVLTFSETIALGAGAIEIRRSSDQSLYQAIDVNTSAVTVSGSVVTINPADLETNTEYYIIVPVGAFRDLSDNPFAGVTASVSWNFTTSGNRVPLITSGNAATVPENTPISSVVLDVNGTDSDLPVQSLTYSLTGADAALFTIDSASGEIRFRATPDYETPLDQDGNNLYEVIVTVTDNGTPPLSATQAITITVAEENDNAPSILSAATASVLEGHDPSISVLDVEAVDADLPEQALIYSISGADAALFEIDSTTGELRFLDSPNFETPLDQGGDNVYQLTISVTDNGTPARTTTQLVAITVLDVNDQPPVFSSTSTVSVPENVSASVVILDINATDSDVPLQTITYSLSGPDADAFLLDPATGELRFVVAPDYESPTDENGDNSYQITVTANDDGNPPLSAAQEIVVHVLPVNDHQPVIVSAATATVPENTTPSTVLIDIDAIDADSPAQSLAYTLAGPGAAYFNINSATGELTFAVDVNYEMPVDLGADNVYHVIVVVKDNGAPGLQTSQEIAITVTPVNEFAPVIQSAATANVVENTPTSTVILDVNATDADLPAPTLDYALSGPDASRLTIDPATGELRFLTPPDFENPVDQGADNTYQVTVTVTDAAGIVRTVTQDLTITVTPDNDESPLFNSVANASIAENSPSSTVLLDVNATDLDSPAQAISYTLDGPDAAHFTLDPVTGQLRFVVSPNFESPWDADGNNQYSLTVVATDSGSPARHSSQAVSITVTNINESPAGLSLLTSAVAENLPVATVVSGFAVDDPDPAGQWTYTLVAGTGSTDNTLFYISGGQLRTAAVFDHETQDTYSIRVRVTDNGGLSYETPLTVSVTDANDAPTDLALSANTLAENSPSGTVVGNLLAVDQDAGESFTYSLQAGIGDIDNSRFEIVGHQLQGLGGFDFEAQSSYQVRIRATDSLGATVDRALTVVVTNVNEEPTALTLTRSDIPEGQSIGTVIGEWVTTDPDAGNAFTYTLVTGSGDEDNASFSLVGNQLRTARLFDYEERDSYSIRVRTTDQGGLSFEQSFVITVTNINEAPLAITLEGHSIAEAQPAGTFIGTLQTTDTDLSDQFTYSFALGSGATDNGRFTIVNDQLFANESFDFETQASYSIRVRSRDSGGLFVFSAFVINVTNQNEAPLSVSLSTSEIAENEPAGTVVGDLIATDPDSDDQVQFTLIPGQGATDNSLFEIVDGQLLTRQPLDRETQSLYTVRVRVTDSGNLSTEQVLQVTALNVNEAPVGLVFTAETLSENAPAGSVAGVLGTVDTDLGDSHLYTLVAGEGAVDNLRFAIQGQQLVTLARLDYEAQSSYSVRIRSADQEGLWIEQVVTVQLEDVNEAPVSLGLSESVVDENQAPGILVGSLSANDPDGDGDGGWSWALVPGAGAAGNAAFGIVGTELRTAATFDFEQQQVYSIRVRVTDAGGLSFEQVLSVTVNNINEAPTVIELSGTSIDENLPTGTEVGTLSTSDPDLADVFSYAFADESLSETEPYFQILEDRLVTTSSLDFEAIPTHTVRIRSTDALGLMVVQEFTITVNYLADPPVVEVPDQPTTLASPKGGLISPQAIVFDQDSDDFRGNRMVITIQPDSAKSGDQLRLLPSGKKSTRLKLSKGQLKLGKTVIGTATGGRNGQPLSITFTSQTDVALVQRVMQQIGLKMKGSQSGSRVLEIQMFDTEGNSHPPVEQEVTP